MDCFDIKVEKANANLKYKRLQKITTLLRLMEVCMFAFIISRISTHLPLAFRVCSDCIQGLSITISSPGFLFILGNAIVVVLFLKSRQLKAQETRDLGPAIEFCDEYVEGCENKVSINKKQRRIHRSQSENLMKCQPQESGKKLRRTVTENGIKNAKTSEEERFVEDEMSGEEFRHAVEAFIARQQRSLREEFSSIVTYGA